MKRLTVLLAAALAVLFATACGARGRTEGARVAERTEMVMTLVVK